MEYYPSSTVLFLDPEQSTLCVTIDDISQFREIGRGTGIFLMLNLDLDHLGTVFYNWHPFVYRLSATRKTSWLERLGEKRSASLTLG